MANYRKDPWGNDNKQPPDLDKLLGDFARKFKTMFGSKQSSSGQNNGINQRQNGSQGGAMKFSTIMMIVVGLLLVLWIALGFFIVSPAEEAVQLRLGKYHATLDSGPHWVPRIIDSYYKVNVQRVNSFNFDVNLLTKSSSKADKLQTIKNTSTSTSKKVNNNDDTDKNVVNIELSVQYRIVDPKLYLFNIVQGEQTLKEVAQSQLSSVVGRMGLNEVLTKGRDQIAMEVSRNIQQLMDQYQAGVSIVSINVRKAQAPEQVADAFLDVVQAGQDEQRYIQQAQAYASKVVPIAEGNSSRILADANAYKEQVVLKAQADVASYLAVMKVYNKAPAVTKQRLYLETLEQVLASNNKVLIDSNSNNNLLYLPLDKLQAASAGSLSSSANTLENTTLSINKSNKSNNISHNMTQQTGASVVNQASSQLNNQAELADIYNQWYQNN